MTKRGRLAMVLTRIIIVAFGVMLFVEQAGALRTPAFWFTLLAPAFFLWALWAATGIFVRIDRGDAFGPAMVRGLKESGGALMLGAFCAIVVQPSLIFLVNNGFREMRGVKFDLDVENVTLLLVGLVLMSLARQGQELKSNLEEFV